MEVYLVMRYMFNSLLGVTTDIIAVSDDWDAAEHLRAFYARTDKSAEYLVNRWEVLSKECVSRLKWMGGDIL